MAQDRLWGPKGRKSKQNEKKKEINSEWSFKSNVQSKLFQELQVGLQEGLRAMEEVQCFFLH